MRRSRERSKGPFRMIDIDFHRDRLLKTICRSRLLFPWNLTEIPWLLTLNLIKKLNLSKTTRKWTNNNKPSKRTWTNNNKPSKRTKKGTKEARMCLKWTLRNCIRGLMKIRQNKQSNINNSPNFTNIKSNKAEFMKAGVQSTKKDLKRKRNLAWK